MSIKVEKSLAVIEDLNLGSGATNQNRNGVDVPVNKIDMPLIIDDYSQLASIDTTKYRLAININDTASGIYKYNYTTLQWEATVTGGQFLGDAAVKSILYSNKVTDEELILRDWQNGLIIDSLTVEGNGSIELEGDAVLVVV